MEANSRVQNGSGRTITVAHPNYDHMKPMNSLGALASTN